MKPFDYYSKLQTAYPNKKDYITSYVYDKGVVLWSGPTREKNKAELKEEYPNALIQEVLDEDAYEARLEEYNGKGAELHSEFRKDIFEEFGVMGNPKRDKAFAYAWDKGHSAGYSEVYGVFSDIVELIED
jgi:phosphomannomutase